MSKIQKNFAEDSGNVHYFRDKAIHQHAKFKVEIRKEPNAYIMIRICTVGQDAETPGIVCLIARKS